MLMRAVGTRRCFEFDLGDDSFVLPARMGPASVDPKSLGCFSVADELLALLWPEYVFERLEDGQADAVTESGHHRVPV